MRLDSRQQMMDYLGAKQRNVMWSWCAVNDDERKVYKVVDFSGADDTANFTKEFGSYPK